jgi:hypothetical protein
MQRATTQLERNHLGLDAAIYIYIRSIYKIHHQPYIRSINMFVFLAMS